jgi:hypothetical protein
LSEELPALMERTFTMFDHSFTFALHTSYH